MVERAPNKPPTAQVIIINGDRAIERAVSDHTLRSRVAYETVYRVADTQAVKHSATTVQPSLDRVSGISAVDGHIPNAGLLRTGPENGVIASRVVSADLYLEVLEEREKDLVGSLLGSWSPRSPISAVLIGIIAACGDNEGIGRGRILEITGIGGQQQCWWIGPLSKQDCLGPEDQSLTNQIGSGWDVDGCRGEVRGRRVGVPTFIERVQKCLRVIGYPVAFGAIVFNIAGAAGQDICRLGTLSADLQRKEPD